MVNWIREKIRTSFAPIWLAIALLAIATAVVLPNYFTGQWAWSQVPSLPETKALRALAKEGISLSDWQVADQQILELGHKKWFVQALTLDRAQELDESRLENRNVSRLDSALLKVPVDVSERLQEEPIFLFLRAQSDVKDEPLVEWIDFDGLQQWTADQVQSVRLTLPSTLGSEVSNMSSASKPLSLLTRYFRGWTQSYTYAVMQWYSWPTGGGAKISDWFWADQWMQLRKHQRMPWVAVTVLVPIKPLGDIKTTQPLVEAIAQDIQTALKERMTVSTDSVS